MKNLYDLRPELAKGGFSWSMQLGNVAGMPFYTIALNKASERVYDELPTNTEIRQFIVENIGELIEDNIVLGGWEHKGKYYLDTSELFNKNDISLGGALQLASKRHQIAIYDLETNKEYKV